LSVCKKAFKISFSPAFREMPPCNCGSVCGSAWAAISTV